MFVVVGLVVVVLSVVGFVRSLVFVRYIESKLVLNFVVVVYVVQLLVVAAAIVGYGSAAAEYAAAMLLLD